jgi:transposase
MSWTGVCVFMRKAQPIVLDGDMRARLEQLAGSRSQPVRLVQRSRIILLAAIGLDNDEIGTELNMTRQKVGRWRSRFAVQGIDGILKEKARPGRPPKIGRRKRAAIVRTTLEERPASATQWSRSLMSAKVGVSPSTVGRIWRTHGLKPHLSRTFKLSNDKQFADKLEDVVGLYVNPPEKAIVFSCDEKSQIQALDRTQPGLPIKKGRCGTMTHDYKRNGTTTLFAALNTLDGTVLETCMPRHRHQEWIRFLNLIKRNAPADKEIHIICDNYATHKHPNVKAWMKRNKRFHVHFTPTSASWLNMVERFFRDISERKLRRGVFRSVDELVNAITDYVAAHNQNPKPFIWTATASDILEKVKRARQKLDKLQSL